MAWTVYLKDWWVIADDVETQEEAMAMAMDYNKTRPYRKAEIMENWWEKLIGA